MTDMKAVCEHPATAGLGMEVGKGATMAIGYAAGRGALGRLLGSPLLLFAAGVAVGYLGFRYRREIVGALTRGTEAGRDLMLNAKESLADLVEETREEEVVVAKAAEPGPTPAA